MANKSVRGLQVRLMKEMRTSRDGLILGAMPGHRGRGPGMLMRTEWRYA
jgi:hypothetical protein